MEVSRQFLAEAVSMILLVALLLTGVRIYQRANTAIGIMETQQEQRLKDLEEYDAVKYDGCKINGITAVSYIRNMVFYYNLPVWILKDGARVEIDSYDMCESIKSEGTEWYVSPFERFQCEIIRDENRALVRAELVSVE